MHRNKKAPLWGEQDKVDKSMQIDRFLWNNWTRKGAKFPEGKTINLQGRSTSSPQQVKQMTQIFI